MKLALATILAAALGSAPAAAGEAVPAPLVVLSDFANPPFASWTEGQAEPVGLEPDVMREVARALARPIAWSKRPFRELLAAVAAGEGDVVAATVGVTAERAKLVAFSRPYYATRIAVLVRNGPGEPEDLAALAGLRVGASRGTTSEAAVRRSLPEVVPVFDLGDKQSFEVLLVEGQVAAAVMDAPAAQRIARERRDSVRVLEQDLGDERYAFAVSKGQPQLLAEIDRVLTALEADGRLRESKTRRGLDP